MTRRALLVLAVFVVAARVAAGMRGDVDAQRGPDRTGTADQSQPLATGSNVATPTGDWREDPFYVDLIASRARRADYRAFVTARPLEAVLRDLAADASLLRPPGAWTPESLGTADAFGDDGEANRWTVARLYGGVAVQVARGPRSDGLGGVENWTLVTPYPDRTLRHLERGTLLLIARVPPL
ncbi:MAG TPA: hypothetical protein VFV95_20640 [Vicinamibacterales bacterium]|nr:hypothetical protein [Vicinamibacterales bacterium]